MHQIALTAYGSVKHAVGAGSAYLCHVQDILIRETLYGHTLWMGESPQQKSLWRLSRVRREIP